MFRLLRRKIYRPKLFNHNDIGSYTRRSNESLETISSSREEVMTPNTLDLMNGHAHKEDDVTSNSTVEVQDPAALGRKSLSSSPDDSGSIYDNDSDSSPLDEIIADLQNVGNMNYASISPVHNSQTHEKATTDIGLNDNLYINETLDTNLPSNETNIKLENEICNDIISLDNDVGTDDNNQDLDVMIYPEPLYSVVRKPKKKNNKVKGHSNFIEEMNALLNEKNNQTATSNSEASNDITERMQLTALLDSIVSEMDIFVSDESEESNEELKSYIDKGKTNSLPIRGNSKKKILKKQDNQSIPVTTKPTGVLKCKSTPNLSKNNKKPDYNRSISSQAHTSGYDSDHELNNEDVATALFTPVDSGKKSVSFNNVVLEFERPRSIYSDGSSDYLGTGVDQDQTDVKKSPLDHIITTDIDADSPVHDGMYRSVSVMSYDCTNGQIYMDVENTEVVPILTDKSRALSLSDDMLSIADEGDVYSDTETEDDRTDGEHTEFVPIKVKRHRKSRTAVLMITWFLLGMSVVLPGTVLPYLAENLNTTWEPLARGLFAKGGGCFLGSVIAWMLIGGCRMNVEVVLVIALLAGAVGIATVPWFTSLYIFCGSNAAEGLARGLFQVGSHIYLIKVWQETTGIELIHALYITMAAGAALMPLVSRPLTQSSIADDIYQAIEAAGMDDILRLNGYKLVLNGSETILIKKPQIPVSAITPSYNATQPNHGLSILQKMYILYFIVAVLILFCGLVFLIFTAYTCAQRCRKTVKEYSHNRKMKKINHLKEKIARSRDSLSSFDHLVMTNGKPGENGSKNGNNGNGKSNGEMKSNGENGTNRNSLIVESESDGNSVTEVKHISEGNQYAKTDKTEHKTNNADVNTKHNANSTDKYNAVDASGKKNVSFKMGFWERKRAAKMEKKKKKESLFLRNKGCSTSALMYMYVFFCLPVAAEVVFTYFIYIFTMQSPLMLNELKASLLLTLFWTCMFLSRILTIPLSKICPPIAIIISCLIMNIMTTIALASYGWKYQKILWVFTALFGFFLGPMLPGGFTWANIYMKHKVKCLALAYCISALGMALFSWMGGMILQYYGYHAIMYLLIGITTLSFLLFLPTMRFIKSSKVFRVKVQKGKEQVYSTSQRTYL